MAAFLNLGTYNQQSTNCFKTQHQCLSLKLLGKNKEEEWVNLRLTEHENTQHTTHNTLMNTVVKWQPVLSSNPTDIIS